ncbi:uncharacterized protein LOC143283882 [Babylonia areolata]|uniref:uncharacterized protein LOC143283882 n=1 Tax=Babylonia areolata TaxID=304850 RepID=UPI003FD386B5
MGQRWYKSGPVSSGANRFTDVAVSTTKAKTPIQWIPGGAGNFPSGSLEIKRRSEYDDFFLYFNAEDLVLCTKSPKLRQYAEKHNNNNNSTSSAKQQVPGQEVTSAGGKKGRPWIKKNRKAVTAATQTLDCGEDGDGRGRLDIEEVEDEEVEGGDGWRGAARREVVVRGAQHGHVTSAASDSMEPPRTSNGYPGFRPTPATRNGQETFRDHKPHALSGSKSNLLSVSTLSSSSSSLSLRPAPDRSTPSTTTTTDPTPRDGAHVLPVGALHEEEDGEDERLDLHHTPHNPRRGQEEVEEDPRSVGLDPMSTLPSVGSDEEHGGGQYRLQPDTPSPRPDTPFHKRLPPHARKLQRPKLVHDVIVDEREDQLHADPGKERMLLRGGVGEDPHTLEPGSKQRKKRISKVLRGMADTGGQHPIPQDPSHTPGAAFRADEGGLFGRDNQAFVKDEPSEERLRPQNKVKYTPIKGLKEKGVTGQQAFPYTSQLLDFVGENSKNKTSYSPSLQATKTGEDSGKKVRRKKSAVQRKAENMLFAPRSLLGQDRHDRNCLSDNDLVDDDLGDMEPDSVMSDVEGVASPRLIPVKKTDRTVSINSVHSPRSDADTDWELTDCELDERPDGPRILPGARGAQQLRSPSAHRSRESSANGGSADPRRRGGVQNDSRRRYIALNSLRRKANQLALQAQLRRQNRPDSSSSNRLELTEM